MVSAIVRNGEIPQLILFNIVGANIFSGEGRGGRGVDICICCIYPSIVINIGNPII